MFGNVHVLCNNAGMGILGPVTLAKYDDWDWGLRVLLGGAVNGIQTVLPRLLAHGEGGHVVNTSSMAGVVPISGAAIYISQAALIGLSEACGASLPERESASPLSVRPVQTNIREGGRMRPDRYGDSGYTELERELEERPTRRSGWTSRVRRARARGHPPGRPLHLHAPGVREAPTSASARCSPRSRTSPWTTSARTTSASSALQPDLPGGSRAALCSLTFLLTVSSRARYARPSHV